MAKDAVGNETQIKLEMGGEYFNCMGLVVEEYNFLEVYTFEKWTDKYVPKFQQGQQFRPSNLSIFKG